jgi:hypothetical protein
MVLAQRTGQGARVLKGADPFSSNAHTRSLISASGEGAAGPSPVAAYSLPINFRGLTEGESGESKAVSFEAVVMVLTDLRYQAKTRRFESRIAVGLRNPELPDDRSKLGDPLKVLISANADAVTPAQLEIQRLGDPQVVEIAASSPQVPFMVSAQTLLDKGDSIEIPVERSHLAVQAARTAIEGLGLGKTTLQIEVPGLHDGPAHVVSLSTTRGEIVPTPVPLDAEGRATVELRSDGTGVAHIRVEGDPFLPATADVLFDVPRNFIIAMLLGALAGWIARMRSHGLSIGSLVMALVCASILSSAYAIGINWLKWAPEATVGEALGFFVAAMGAYTGMRALKLATAEGRE